MRYLVETNDRDDGVYTVLNSPSVPQIGAYYIATNEYDLGARCVDARASHVDGDPKLWHVECTFKSIQREDPEDQEEKAPEEREPMVSYRFEKRQTPLMGDYDDAAAGKLDTSQGVANSLNQPFSPPPMIDETFPVLTVIRDDLALGMGEIFSVQDTINLTEFSGAPAETLKLNVTGVQERFEDGRRLWRKTYELAYNKRTWATHILDHGYLEDDDGNWRQVLLDGAGAETTVTSPHYDAYDPYKKLEFRTVAGIRDLAAEQI
jgi:hypothetical protein